MNNMKSTSTSQYSDVIVALLESEAICRQQSRRSQRRSMIRLLWVLLTLVMTLVMIANIFASGHSDIVDGSTSHRYNPLKQYDQLHHYQTEYQHNREISIWNYEDIQEYYRIAEYEEKNASNYQRYKWSEEQIEEMERHYKRYLEVFFRQHGDEYEPEDKEVVYAEYLAFRGQKALEKEKAVQNQTGFNTPRQDDSTEQAREEDHIDAPSSAVGSHILQPSPIANHVMIMDWTDFNEVGENFCSPSNNNYTQRMATRTKAVATAITSSKTVGGGRKDAGVATSTKQRPISGRPIAISV